MTKITAGCSFFLWGHKKVMMLLFFLSFFFQNRRKLCEEERAKAKPWNIEVHKMVGKWLTDFIKIMMNAIWNPHRSKKIVGLNQKSLVVVVCMWLIPSGLKKKILSDCLSPQQLHCTSLPFFPHFSSCDHFWQKHISFVYFLVAQSQKLSDKCTWSCCKREKLSFDH